MSATQPDLLTIKSLSGGYRRLRWPDHPLGSNGYVLEHRAVFWAHNGAGPHVCHWCGCALRLEPGSVPSGNTLVVDHLDGDKLNNQPGNLRPACIRCNTGRVRKPEKYIALRASIVGGASA